MSSGINDIPAKLNSICPSFDMWNSWFGESQKYDPSSIISNDLNDGASEPGDSGDGQKSDADDDGATLDRTVDSIHGGVDAALDAAGGATESTALRQDSSPRVRGSAVQEAV